MSSESRDRAPTSTSRKAVTVVIPVKNGGSRLRECLAAVFAQRAPFPFNVLCIDSGSTDGSVDAICATPANLIQIPPSDFGHGRTRNLAISNTPSPFIAMLTQDAVPANERWLAELIAPFEDETVAGVFGPHAPHEGCAPAEARMLATHFANFGHETTVYAIPPTEEGWNDYVARKPFHRFFSDNNAALRRSVWASIPYPDVEFMEDQLWCSAILEAGWAKAYAPKAVVRHSHNYRPLEKLQRGFDEARYFREYFDDPRLESAGQRVKHAVSAGLADAANVLRDSQLNRPARVMWAARSLIDRFADSAGRYLGDRSQLLPHAVERRISQHHVLKGDVDAARQTPTTASLLLQRVRQEVRERSKLDLATEAVRKTLFTARGIRKDGVTRTVGSLRRMAIEARRSREWWEGGVFPYVSGERQAVGVPAPKHPIDPKRLVLNWVIPPFGPGGGGHLNIFRMIHQLERLGHRSRVYVMDGKGANPVSGVKMRAEISKLFVPINASVHHLEAEMLPADVVLATAWQTAYPVRASSCAPHRAYFIQDYEPLFFPMSSSFQLAEDTYRWGFFGITAGPWLEKIVTEKYGMRAKSFPLAVEHRDYWPVNLPRNGRRRLFAYVRPSTERRGFELVSLALQRIHRAFPEVEIHLAGSALPVNAMPLPFVCHGILNATQLRNLYSSCDVAICVSLTNYSLLPQEIIACGCPVVDVDGENTRMAYPEGSVVLVPPSVEGLTNGVTRLLANEDLRRAQIAAGLEYTSKLSWESAARIVEQALLEAVDLGTQSPGAPRPLQLAR